MIESTEILFDRAWPSAEIEILSQAGESIRSVQIQNTSSFQLFRGDLPRGIYLLRITSENNLIGARKLIIQ